MRDKAGDWFRVSTAGQDEDSQRPDVARWNVSHDYDVRKTYTIHGKSAYHGSKEFDANWAEVLDDFRTGVIDVLVVWKTDRLDRKLETFRMLSEVADAGGRVEFVTQPHLNDLTTMGGRISLKVAEEIAHEESVIKRDRILAKQSALRASGSAVGRAPWGYAIVKRDGLKVYAPTADGRLYVPVIFRMAIDGKSLREIAEYLTREEVPTATGQSVWNESYLGNGMLKNPMYYGSRRNAGALDTEKLVSYSEWQQANVMLKSRVRKSRKPVRLEKAMLAPKCGNPDCNATGVHPSPMYRVYCGKAPSRTPYYRCTGSGPQRKGCGNMVPADELDKLIIADMTSADYPHTEQVFIAGDDRSEVGRLRDKAMAAYARGDRQLFAELDQQASKLDVPAISPHWETRETGQTEGEYFRGLSADSMRAELAKRYVIRASRDGSDVQAEITTPGGLGFARYITTAPADLAAAA